MLLPGKKCTQKIMLGLDHEIYVTIYQEGKKGELENQHEQRCRDVASLGMVEEML